MKDRSDKEIVWVSKRRLRAIWVAVLLMEFTSFISTATATEACVALARRMSQSITNFPTVNINSLREIIVWRASHCEEPPRPGPGNIAIMCEVETFDRHSILFWERNNKGQFSRGFLSCPIRY